MMNDVQDSHWGSKMHLIRARAIAVALSIPVGVMTVGSATAFAQDPLDNPGTLSSGAQQNLHSLDKQQNKQAAPPSLPGTKPASEAALPTASPSDMSPTDALFDAINRGDIASARDAVNRGADLHGVNILGLTPLELSVDLGRNDISFFLLSMRDEDAGSRSAARSGGAVQSATGPGPSLAPKRASRARVTAAAQPAEEPVAEGPRLFSGNGGAPIPSAGFLGFDNRQAAR